MRLLACLLILPMLAGCLAEPESVAEPAPVPAPQNSGIQWTGPDQDAIKSRLGAWEEPFEGQIPAITMALLGDGRVLYWSGVEATANASSEDLTFFTAEAEGAVARIYDPATGAIVEANQPDDLDLFCSGLTMLPDGRILTAGGTTYTTFTDIETSILHGEARSRIFDPATNNWSEAPTMLLDRWYPSVFLLADGTPAAASGIGELTAPETQWRTWETLHDEWHNDPDSEDLLPLYPRLFVLPGGERKGEVFYTTSATLWGPFGEHQEEASWSLQQSYDADTGTWTQYGPSTFGARQYASSVLLPLSPDDGYAPRFVNFGGTLQRGTAATPLVELTDMSGPEPANTMGPTMVHARWHHNGVLLPDGDVLVIGGGQLDNVILHGQENPPVLEAERFDPDTSTWHELAAMEVPRMYHSSALLLPDGRVLAGGHVPLPHPSKEARDTINPQTVETRFEIYNPGYLFRGERPHIEHAPPQIGYGEAFSVNVTGDIIGAVLVRPGTTTHAYDTGQRVVELVGTQTEAGWTFTAPPDAAVLAPGPQMLFVLADHPDGPVPSTAAWVTLS